MPSTTQALQSFQSPRRRTAGAFKRAWPILAALVALMLVTPTTPIAAAVPPDGFNLPSEGSDRTWQVRDLQPAAESTLPDWDVLVWDFAEMNDTIYVGGRFTTVRKYSGATEHDQAFLAAFDRTTGEWIDSFRPVLNDGVYSLSPSPDGSLLLVGGEFTEVNGQPLTSGLVALNPFTGEPDPDWKASFADENDEVVIHEILVDDQTEEIYVGGRFSHVESAVPNSRTRRYSLARLESDGSLDRDWDVKAGGGRVMALDIDRTNNRLWIGGFFANLDLVANTRWAGVADLTDGTVSALTTPINQGEKYWVFDLVVAGSRAYVATERHWLYLYDLDTTRQTRYHSSGYGGDTQALHYDGEVIWVGGHHHGKFFDMDDRPEVVQTQWISPMDPTTGEFIDNWHSRFGMKDGVWAIYRDSAGDLWVGGDPTSSGTTPVSGFGVLRNDDNDGETNLARRQPASQSSSGPSNVAWARWPDSTAEDRCNTFGHDLIGQPERAVDGKIGAGASECSFSSTAAELEPWWQVDLGQTGEVDMVRIWNLYDTDARADLADAYVAVSNDPDAIDTSDVNALIADPAVTVVNVAGQLGWYTEVPVGVYGRYVRVGMNRADPVQLRLGEVEVLDLDDVQPPPPPDEDRTIIEAGATWRFQDDGVAAPADWQTASFDDAAWAEGAAPLGFGDDGVVTTTQDQIITTYFRYRFDAPAQALANGLVIDLLADDGAVVSVNGVEAGRLRMPAGPIGNDTVAADTVWGAAEEVWTSFEVSPDHLAATDNVITVEVHNNWRGGGDLRFDARVAWADGPIVPVAVDQLLIPAQADWRYLDTGVAPGAGWTEVGFDDDTWSVGAGQLGYGDGDEATVIDEGPAGGRHITHWFRHTFEVVDPDSVAELALSLVRDDGAVVYLNGVEVVRSNMAAGEVTSSTLAADYAWGPGEAAYHQHTVAADALTAGTNVVAVEVHSADPGSSDFSFDLELVGKAR